MGPTLAARLATPAARTGIYYASLFMTGAVSNPFLPIWLTERGVTPQEIGFINAAPIFAMIAINLVVGRIADRASDWRTVIVAGSIFAAIPPIFLLAVDGYLPILVIWTLLIVPFQAIAPVVDAATYRMARRNGYDFGAIRVWGTIGFVVMTLVTGLVLDWQGAIAFVPLLIAVSLARAALSLQLPLFRGHDDHARPTYPIDAPISPLVAVRMGELWKPWFLLTLIGASLLHGSHMMQMGFGALIWAGVAIAHRAVDHAPYTRALFGYVVFVIAFTPVAVSLKLFPGALLFWIAIGLCATAAMPARGSPTAQAAALRPMT